MDHDGTVRWRIDLVDDQQVQMESMRLGKGSVSVPDGNEDEAEEGNGNTEATPKIPVTSAANRCSLVHETVSAPIADRNEERRLSSVPAIASPLPAILAHSAAYTSFWSSPH